ncbi:MAG: ATP-binding protein [Thermodesulfobacteriota bacterium]
MSRSLDHIHAIREQVLNRYLYLAALLAIFPLMASLIRALRIGWQPAFYLHIGAYVLILACVILRRYLSFCFRAATLIVIGLGLAIAGMLSWGLFSLGAAALFAFCVFATILFGTTAGVISAILSGAFMGAIGTGIHLGLIGFHFDANAYLTSPASWLNSTVAVGVLAALIVAGLGTVNTQLTELVLVSDARNRELAEANGRLSAEIARRVKAEEERQQAEMRLKRAEKMEAIGTLAAGVAHDLNNVLAGIVSYPDVLLMDLPEKSPLRQPLTRMQKTGEKAAAIVQDLLTMARRGVAITEVIDLNAVVSDYLKSLECGKLTSFHPGVQIETKLEEGLLAIEGSPVRLSKVIMNLVSNAAEAMPSGGRISIATGRLSLAERVRGYEEIDPGEYVTLTVADTGVGISTQDTDKIFEPFYTKKVMGRSGTGLGMSVVWGTVKDHDGYIDIQSAEGKGTAFTLYFPATRKELSHAAVPSPLAAAQYMGRGEAILVVDDVNEQRELACEMIGKLGYRVAAVPGGKEAVDYFRENSADLVLLDMIMDPGIDGLDTYKAIIGLRPGQKAVLASGFAETERVKEAMDLGVAKFIRKPFSLERIGTAIRTELDRQ